MAEQKNIITLFNTKAFNLLDDIEKKYNLEETHEEFSVKMKMSKTLNINIVARLTKDLFLKKVSNQEFLDSLHKELGISKEATKNLALDIMDKLIPLLEKIPEDQLEEYNKKKRLEKEKQIEEQEKKIEEQREKEKKEIGPTTQEILLEKIRGKTSESPLSSAQTIKKVEVKDVGKNAEMLKKEREETAKPGTTSGELQHKSQTDKYREPTE